MFPFRAFVALTGGLVVSRPCMCAWLVPRGGTSPLVEMEKIIGPLFCRWRPLPKDSELHRKRKFRTRRTVVARRFAEQSNSSRRHGNDSSSAGVAPVIFGETNDVRGSVQRRLKGLVRFSAQCCKAPRTRRCRASGELLLVTNSARRFESDSVRKTSSFTLYVHPAE